MLAAVQKCTISRSGQHLKLSLVLCFLELSLKQHCVGLFYHWSRCFEIAGSLIQISAKDTPPSLAGT